MIEKEIKKTRYQVDKIKKLNSKSSDYSPAYASDTYDYLVFASMRTEGKKKSKNKITGQGTSSLYFSKIDVV